MTPQELMDLMSSKIYSEPLSKIRDSGQIRDLNFALHNFMLIIDFNTECEMNGIYNFFGNSTGLYVRETVQSLRNIEASICADQLSKMLEISEKSGMTYESIQLDRAVQARENNNKYGFVTSWEETHKGKWDKPQDEISMIYRAFDSGEMLQCLERYVSCHMDELHSAVASA